MSKGESGLEIMWFHLECFLFFQSTSLKTINHSVSQPNCSLWKVSMQQAWRAESPPRLVELGRLVQLRTHLASPETWWCFKRSWSCLYPCHEWAVPQHHRCDHTVSVEEVSDLRQGAVLEQTLSFCYQPLHNWEQSHDGGTMKKKSPVICCVNLHPHLSVLLTSSCISGACTVSPVGTWSAYSCSHVRLGPICFEWWSSQ